VVAQLTGALITSSGGEGGPDLAQVMPAGTWKVHITDSGGATVQDFSADRKAGGYSTATSFSWPDVAAGDYKATATFTATGGPASNFDIADSAPATFTAPGAAPGDESTAAPAPSEPAAAADTGPDVPAWLLLAVGVVTAALLALVVFQIVQLARVDRAPVAAAAAAQPATSATDGSAR
jgi:hypothetical protein